MLIPRKSVSQGKITQSVWSNPEARGIQLRLVQTPEELKAVQKLRYDVFTSEMNAVFPSAELGLDIDKYDEHCIHFMVVDEEKKQVVGTYRMLLPEGAKKVGAYYSESEFDISALDSIRDSVVEVGRSCIHPAYRNGGVIMLLWTGIVSLTRQAGFRYLLGCASVSLRDDGVTAAKVWREAKDFMERNPSGVRLQPLHRYPVEKLNSQLPARIPPLIKGYLNLGAQICGEPAWDPDFNTADFPILLDMEDMDIRYKRHFGIADE